MDVKRLIFFTIALFSSALSWATTCAEYNALGPRVSSMEELHQHPISPAQINVVREMTALKASRVAAMQYTPLAQKLAQIMSDKSLLGELAGGTSTMVRGECFESPKSDLYDAVSEQFEIVLEYMSEKYK